ncbi:MAG: RDD family protein [Thermostichales cyanobacterium SZTDM-1c_bins_54]
MVDPRLDPSRMPERRPLRDYAEPEWQTFNALPPPSAKLGFPVTETATASEIGTQVKLATWQKRLGAFALDMAAGLGVAYLAQGVASLLGVGAASVDVVGYGAFFLTWLINRGYFQSRPRGQSLGKWLMSIKVIDPETDQSPGIVRSVAREGVTSVFLLTEALLVPLAADSLFAIFDKEKRQSIHDRAGRTLVVEGEGFDLDEKALAALQGILDGETISDLKAALKELAEQAQENETIADVTDQVKLLSKRVQQSSQATRKQVGNWLENIKEKLDNW